MKVKTSYLRRTAIFFAATLFTTTAAVAQGYRGTLAFTTPQVQRTNDSLYITTNVVLDDLRVESRSLLTLTPKLVSKDGTQVYNFPQVNIGSRNRAIMYRRENGSTATPVVRRHNGQQQNIELHLTAPNHPWMRAARLAIEENVSGCAGCEMSNNDYTLIDRILREPYTPNYRLATLMPAPDSVKLRSDKFVARFNFRVNRYELLPNLGNNRREFERVDSIAKEILVNNDVMVRNVSINGYASPEGYYEANQLLALNRANSFVDYLKKTYGLNTYLFSVEGHGEDWAGLIKAVSTGDMDYREEILDILSRNQTSAARKDALKKFRNGVPYVFMLENYYPPLRRTEYEFTYNVRGFSLEEAIERINKRPRLLSIEEMYRVAFHYPEGSPERANALGVASKIYPDDPTHRFNLLSEKLLGNGISAAEFKFLQSLPETPEKLNTLGIYYAARGEYAQAKACFEKALPSAAASHNLSELQMKMESE